MRKALHCSIYDDTKDTPMDLPKITAMLAEDLSGQGVSQAIPRHIYVFNHGRRSVVLVADTEITMQEAKALHTAWLRSQR